MAHVFPKPYQDLDEMTERVIRACYARLVERGEPYPDEDLRFDERVHPRDLARWTELRLLSKPPRASSPAYVPTALALLYLPEAEKDVGALDAFVRLTHARYRPRAEPLTSEGLQTALGLEAPELDRIGLLLQDMGYGWTQDSVRRAPLYDWMREVPDLAAALLRQFARCYSAENAELPGPPATFDLRPRGLRLRGFRALRDVELSTPGLTALVGANGVGKSTLLDAYAFLRNAARNGAEAAVQSEAGIERLKARGFSGPVELAFDFALDYGDSDPISGQYLLAIDDLRGRVVVERESLTLARRDGTASRLIDGRRGRCRLMDPDGNIEERLQSAGTLTLSRLGGREQEKYPIANDLRDALSEIVLIDRDPLFNQGTEIISTAKGAMRKRRGGQPVVDLLEAVARSPELTERLGAIVKEFVPDILAIRRVVKAGWGTELEVVEKDGGAWRMEELSAGTRQLLLLASVYLRPRPLTLVLLEEPDAGVHPGNHPALRDLLRSIAKRSGVILTTHSPSFVGLLDPETEVVALERGPDGTELRSLTAALQRSGWLKAFGSGADAIVRIASEKSP